jgi:hypothetical protein
MEPSLVVEDVKNLEANSKRFLEEILGGQLREDQQVFIMVLSPGTAPDAEARRQASLGLERVFQQTEAYARQHGVTDTEIDAAIKEAMAHVRPETD